MENKDMTLKIMLELDDRELFVLCGKKDSLEFKNRRFSKLCNNEFFWEKRFINRFGKLAGSYKPKDRSWKKHYLTVVIQLDEFKGYEWEFFNYLIWSIRKTPENSKIKYDGYSFPLDKAEESLHNAFWMLELGKDITISYPIDKRGELKYINVNYKDEMNFTPGKVLKLIYDFYQEKVSEDDLDTDLSFEDDEELKRVDLMEGLTSFDGFTNKNGVKVLSLY